KGQPEDIFIHRFYTAFHSFLIYISILIFPFILSMERHIPYIKTAKNLDFITGFIFLLFFIWFIYKKRTDKRIFFAGTLFLLNFLFHSNILIPLNGNLREHWMYMGGIGFFVYFVILIEMIKKGNLKKVLLILVFSLYGIRTILRNYDWNDPERFYLKSLKYFPKSYKLWNNLGVTYFEKGLYEKAVDYFKKTLEISPDAIKPLIGLAKSYYMLGKYKEAEETCNKILKIKPDEANSYSILGLIYKHKGNYKKGFEYLLNSIKYDPHQTLSYYFIGKWFLELHDYKNAGIFFKKGIEIDPTESLNYNGLGIVYLEYYKNYPYALYLFQKAHRIKNNEASYMFNIGKTYQILNDHKSAILWFEKGLSLDKNNLQVMNDMAISYLMIGEKEKAKRILEEIIKKDKNFTIAIENLKKLESLK
ncbi:MAG: tetratricopeptide repeat protein, partial [Candidatus Omnitrophica bacterium]|nr:tetratricopeptide repeat protein [Candidatus Omnitrophota bacterium]